MEGTSARLNELTAVINREAFEAVPALVAGSVDLARWRRFRKDYHAAQRLERVPPFPLQIDFELSSICNFRCAFCTHGQQKVEPRALGFDRFARVIDEGQAWGLVSVKLNYINEPLMVPDLPRYIDYARSRGVLNTYFATNGLLLDERVARALIESQLSKVLISLDAVTPETFLAMRRSSKLGRIVANIDRLLDIREQLGVRHPIVRVNFLKTGRNIHEAPAFIERWRGRADMVGLQDRVLLPGEEEDAADAIDRQLEDFRCSFPFKQVVIDSAGSILPCCTFSGRSMPIGHVDTDTVVGAWTSPKMRALRQLQVAGRWRENRICANCIGGCAT